MRDGMRERDLGIPSAVILHPEPHLVQVTMPVEEWDALVDGTEDPDQSRWDAAYDEGFEDGYNEARWDLEEG